MRNSTQYKLAGPKTFRRSSVKIQGYYGGNLQNIEKGLREIYEPDGYTEALREKCRYWLETGDYSIFTEEQLLKTRVFLQTDQSGAEALIVAYDCEAKNYRQLFIHKVKPHVYVALKLFKSIWKEKMRTHGVSGDIPIDVDAIADTPISELKKNPYWRDLDLLIKDSDNWSLTERYYYLAKQTVHSANYDIQPPTFRMNILEKSGGKIVISKEESERFLMVYRSLFPEIPDRNRRVADQVEKHKLIYNMLGFPYQITNYIILDNKLKEYYAWGPQSTVGEITRIAFSNMYEYIESSGRKWDLLADTHDSYLVQCPLMDVRDCRAKMQEFMNQRLTSPVDGVEFNMQSECQIGFNWAPAKIPQGKNLLGLQELKWLN